MPNIPLATMSPPPPPRREYKEEVTTTLPQLPEVVAYRTEGASAAAPEAATRRRRHDVHSASYDYHIVPPPTRQPPAPPITDEAVPPPTQLDIPNFDHFAEKYALISASSEGKQSGIYVKYEQVDDVPELLTPDDDQVGAAISVAAMVHQMPGVQAQSEPQQQQERVESTESPKVLQLEHTDSAFVVEIIAGTPDSTEHAIEPLVAANLFDNLDLGTHEMDAEFELKRSSYEMNEADILDMQPDFSELQPVGSPSSPPGFGKSIDEDWENFENLDHVADLPQPNWAVHPALLESPITPEQATLFEELELIDPTEVEEALPAEVPPYEEDYSVLPPLPILPDYESLMQQEISTNRRNLPNYADVVKEKESRYVSTVDDLFEQLQVNGETSPTDNSTQVDNFDELCEQLHVVAASPVPATRSAPQPTPRVTKPTTLNTRGNAAVPFTCYAPEELPGSSSSDDEVVPKPAKRQVRFDVVNLQYYQSAELPSTTESEDDDPPRLFGTRVTQEYSDDDDEDEDDTFTRTIQQHRDMTDNLRSVVELNGERALHENRVRYNDTEA